MRLIDLTGRRFGRLIVIRQKRRRGVIEILWLCKCDCGKTKTIFGSNLRSGFTTSCGCFHKEITALRKTTHGHARKKRPSRVYQSWCAMISRCTKPNNKQWNDYGGRGIKVCRRWRKFENFLTDMGEAPLGKTLDRYPDNNGNYEPSNCRWATPKQQANNRRLRKDAKMTQSDVKEALTLLATGNKIKIVADQFGVSDSVLRYHRKKRGSL